MSQCHKCKGTGVVEAFRHIEGGMCFECSGAGILDDARPQGRVLGARDEECDHSPVLYRRTVGGAVSRVRFYVWDDGTGKERAGSGQWYHCLSTVGDAWETVSKSRVLPVADMRAEYRAMRAAGYASAL